MLTVLSWESIASLTSPTDPATRRSSTSTPVTPVSRSGRLAMLPSVLPSAGISGSPSAPESWLSWALRSSVFSRLSLLSLVYPTAIGSEPQDSTLDSHEHWRRVMQGHAGVWLPCRLPLSRPTTSLSSPPTVSELRSTRTPRLPSTVPLSSAVPLVRSRSMPVWVVLLRDAVENEDNVVLTQSFDLDAIRAARASWGQFRYFPFCPLIRLATDVPICTSLS